MSKPVHPTQIRPTRQSGEENNEISGKNKKDRGGNILPPSRFLTAKANIKQRMKNKKIFSKELKRY
ncbi:MAG: hypothetical protein RQM95_11960 [Syntrophaceticus schinkii]